MTDTKIKNQNHQMLVNSIATAVYDILAPLFEAQTLHYGQEFAKMHTSMAASLARLEVLELKTIASDGTKRAPRGMRKTGRTTAAAAKNSSDDKAYKVANGRLYCRFKWATDETFREKYLTPQIADAFNSVDAISKHDENTVKRWHAEGFALWDHHLTEGQRVALKKEFDAWRLAGGLEEVNKSLEADDGADDNADDAGEDDA